MLYVLPHEKHHIFIKMCICCWEKRECKQEIFFKKGKGKRKRENMEKEEREERRKQEKDKRIETAIDTEYFGMWYKSFFSNVYIVTYLLYICI